MPRPDDARSSRELLAQIPAKTGLVVFAIKKEGRYLELNPSGNLILGVGDVLLILGRETKIKKLRSLAQDFR